MTQLQNRELDLAAIKGLSHPLRVRMYNKLSELGPMTACGLGELLGESSGSTSYHLRQLEKHGLVREVEGRGTKRERWWERTPGPITISDTGPNDTPAAREVVRDVSRQQLDIYAQNVRDFINLAHDALPERWADANSLSVINEYLPIEAVEELKERCYRLMLEIIDPYRGKQVPGSRPVQIHFNAFALIGGEEVTE
jgi:DNA-binding transcriptional ArsR family regulator